LKNAISLSQETKSFESLSISSCHIIDVNLQTKRGVGPQEGACWLHQQCGHINVGHEITKLLSFFLNHGGQITW